jgi:hypothetical protein
MDTDGHGKDGKGERTKRAERTVADNQKPDSKWAMAKGKAEMPAACSQKTL